MPRVPYDLSGAADEMSKIMAEDSESPPIDPPVSEPEVDLPDPQFSPDPKPTPNEDPESPAPEPDQVASPIEAPPSDFREVVDRFDRRAAAMEGYIASQHEREQQARAEQQRAAYEQQQEAWRQYYGQLDPYQQQQLALQQTQQELQQLKQGYKQQQDFQRTWEVREFQAAEQRLRDKYGDEFDRLVPPSERQKALQATLGQGRYGNTWEQNMHNAFKMQHYEELDKAKKELEKAQKQAKSKETRQAAAVPPSKSNYQAPVIKLDKYRKGYGDAVKASIQFIKEQSAI